MKSTSNAFKYLTSNETFFGVYTTPEIEDGSPKWPVLGSMSNCGVRLQSSWIFGVSWLFSVKS